MRTALVILLLIAINLQICNAELISTAFAGATAGLAAGVGYFYTSIQNKWYESCNDDWITSDFRNLMFDIRENLYGQHLVESTVVNSLRKHFHKDSRPSKALVMSFHGSTGAGKNYVSNMIGKNMYKKGTRSQFFHQFVSTIHFPLARDIDKYKVQLHQWITGNISACPRSIFVFDEVDKMHGDVLEAIRPYLGYYEQLDGVDYRKAVFIFLSNTAGDDIVHFTTAAHMKGTPRESLKMVELEALIGQAAYNEPGGLQYSNLLKNHAIDHQVAFLPLTREHVKLCVRDYIRKNYNHTSKYDTEENQRLVADMLQYTPNDLQLFSKSGCKKVSQKTDLVIQALEDEETQEWD